MIKQFQVKTQSLKAYLQRKCIEVSGLGFRNVGFVTHSRKPWDLFPQSLGVDTLPPPDPNPPREEFNYTVGFKDLNGKHRNVFLKNSNTIAVMGVSTGLSLTMKPRKRGLHGKQCVYPGRCIVLYCVYI